MSTHPNAPHPPLRQHPAARSSDLPADAATSLFPPALSLTMFDPAFPGAPVLRSILEEASDAYRKRDRRPVVRYGHRPAPASTHRFTTAERWLVNRDGQRVGNDFFIAGTIRDNDAQSSPLETRASLRRLLGIASFCNTDILVEANHPNRDVLALLGHFADKTGRRVILSGASTTNPHRRGRPDPGRRYSRAATETYAGWRAQADEHTTARALKQLVHDATADLVATESWDDTANYARRLLGCEDLPVRDPALAAVVDQHLRGHGWHDRDIRDYLALHGFVNTKGGLGIWNHANLEDVRATSTTSQTGKRR